MRIFKSNYCQNMRERERERERERCIIKGMYCSFSENFCNTRLQNANKFRSLVDRAMMWQFVISYCNNTANKGYCRAGLGPNKISLSLGKANLCRGNSWINGIKVCSKKEQHHLPYRN